MSKIIKFPKQGGDATSLTPINARLKELGKTQAWLAKQTGFSIRRVNDYANRKAEFRAGSLATVMFCKALGIDTNELLFGRNQNASMGKGL